MPYNLWNWIIVIKYVIRVDFGAILLHSTIKPQQNVYFTMHYNPRMPIMSKTDYLRHVLVSIGQSV